MSLEHLQIPLPKTGIFARCYVEAVTLLRRPVLLAAYIPLLVVEAALLLALSDFPYGAISGPLVSAYRWVGGDAALHYPRALAVLPEVFRRGDLLLGLAVGSLCRAWLIGLLPAALLGDALPWRAAAGTVLKRARAIWLVSVPVTIVRAVGFAGYDFLANGPLAGDLGALGWVGLFVFVVGTVAEALFCYALAALVLGGVSALQALARTLSLASRNFWVTAGFIMAPSVLLAPVRMVESGLEAWFKVFAPERAGLVVAAGVVAALLGHFIRVVALTRFYLHWYGVEGEAE